MKEVEETSFCSFHNSLGKSRIEILRQFSRFFFRFVLNSFLFYGSLSSRKFPTTVLFSSIFSVFLFLRKKQVISLLIYIPLAAIALSTYDIEGSESVIDLLFTNAKKTNEWQERINGSCICRFRVLVSVSETASDLGSHADRLYFVVCEQ